LNEIRTYDIAEIDAELAELFESDVKEFSENGARAFGHILAKHGIDDHQKWFEEKMREDKDPSIPPYSLPQTGVNSGISDTGKIKFGTLAFARDKFTRAHEMAHKITQMLENKRFDDKIYSVGRCGFSYIDVKLEKNGNTGNLEEIHCVGAGNGRVFNEGVTNLFAEKLSGLKRSEKPDAYGLFTLLAKQIAEIIGEDLIFEAALFNPQILANEWNERKRDKYSYVKLIHSMDEIWRICFHCNESERAKAEMSKNAERQYRHEIRKGIPISKKIKFNVAQAFQRITPRFLRYSWFQYFYFRYKEIGYNEEEYIIVNRSQDNSEQADKEGRESAKQALQNVNTQNHPETKNAEMSQSKKHF